MDSSRRGFLKIAGLGAVGVAGGGLAAGARASQGGGHAPAEEHDGPRWAMVIDLRKFGKDDALVGRCIEACHHAHNVPDFADDPKNEVKWLWAEEFETAFHEQEFHFIREDLKGKHHPAPVQPLRQPAMHPGVPDPGHLET
jgi:hypothetical protein